MTDVPDGFVPLFRTSPFLDALGPFYQRPDGESLIIGLRIAEHHTNARQTAHGGLLATLADIALGYNASFLRVSKEPGAVSATPLITANLSLDFMGSARLGDWIEAHVDIPKVGRRLAFANAYLLVGQERIARASAVFAVASREMPVNGKDKASEASS